MKWQLCDNKMTWPDNVQYYYIIIRNANGKSRSAKFQSDNIVKVKDQEGKYTLEYTWNYLVSFKYYWRYVTENEIMAFL